MDGPAGCIAGETRIYNPITGTHTPIRDLYRDSIAPIVQTLRGAIQAEKPFIKGVADLFRVRTRSGRECTITGNHLFLTPGGWRYASSLQIGLPLLVSASPLHQTIEASYPSMSLQDAWHLSQKAQGYQHDCFACHYHGDAQLLAGQDIALSLPLLQGDAHAHTRDDPYRDDRGFLREYTHPHLPYAPLSMPDYFASSVQREYNQCHGQRETSLLTDALFQYDGQSQIEKCLVAPMLSHCPDVDSMPLHEPLSVQYPFSSVNRLRDEGVSLALEQSKQCSSFSDTTQEYSVFPGQMRDDILSFHTSNSDYTAQWDTVSSIEYVRTDEYYDLHVPHTHHYLAEGMWHHNTGKTFACLYKVHMMLTYFPGTKALVARKTSVALASTAIATYKSMIDPREGITFFSGNRIRPAAFEYPNGSQMILTGLDKPEKVKSLEIDLAYINEATECDLQDLEFVRSRLRHGKLPYYQVIMDVNPEGPSHWLNLRMNSGVTKRLVSRFEDNPRFYDADGRLTPDGDMYINKILAGLTGVRLMRLFYGKWVGAEGSIYADTWDRRRNVIKPFRIPADWPRYLAVDFGFKHPFVCLWIAVDPDGRLILYREWYKTNMIVEDHAKVIKRLSRWGQPGGEPPPRQIICDHDAEDRATLERHLGMMTTKAYKEVRSGIQAVQARFRDAGDGRARFEVFENALVERDAILDAEKKPIGFIEEVDSYVWAMNHDGSYRNDEPVKEYDHSCDPVRYICARFDRTPGKPTYKKTIWK